MFNRKTLGQNIIRKIDVQDYIKKIAEDFYKEQFECKKVLGVFIRGTDYISIKPKNHFIQPSIDQVINKIDEYMSKERVDYIFAVTEDHEYYKRLNDRYKDKIIFYGNNYISKTSKIKYNSEVSSNNYIRNLEYLVKVIILSMCENIICSKASGSMFSYSIRSKKPKYEYWFDLGKY